MMFNGEPNGMPECHWSSRGFGARFVVEVVPENRSGVSECDPRVGIAQA
jgi:hypothetical protein